MKSIPMPMSAKLATTQANKSAAVKQWAIAIAVTLAILFLMATVSPAYAGSDTTFDELVAMVKNWLQGSGGKFLALLGLAIALYGGLVRGSVVGIVFGLALALASIYGPDIILNMFSAVF